jgi:hypothetical protein
MPTVCQRPGFTLFSSVACNAPSHCGSDLARMRAPMFRRRSMGRRVFLRDAARALAATLGARAWNPNRYAGMALSRRGPTARAVGATLRIAIVATPGSESAGQKRDTERAFFMGIALGMDEAARAATLLGGGIAVVARVTSVRDAAALLERDAPGVLICAANAAEVAELAGDATRRGVVLVNATATADVLRNARCARLLFHVAASDAMRADAQRLWSTQAGSAATPPDEPALWDARLERFGAGQLNARFESRFHHPMDSDAWAGWFAVKVAWEASQRARSVDGASIAEYLERDTTQFDGQKGVPLSFRRWDHQLRQPLYVAPTSDSPVRDARAERSAPPTPIPAPDATPARAALDALGTSEQASTCRWT